MEKPKPEEIESEIKGRKIQQWLAEPNSLFSELTVPTSRFLSVGCQVGI